MAAGMKKKVSVGLKSRVNRTGVKSTLFTIERSAYSGTGRKSRLCVLVLETLLWSKVRDDGTICVLVCINNIFKSGSKSKF